MPETPDAFAPAREGDGRAHATVGVLAQASRGSSVVLGPSGTEIVFEDAGPARAGARDIRATLSDVADWSFDVRSAIQAFVQARPDSGRDPTRTPTVTPSPFAAGQSAGRFVRATRALLAGRDDTTAMDLWEAIERSESLSSLREGTRRLWTSDVFDVTSG